MIVRLKSRNGAILHFDIPDWHAGRADQRVIWNCDTYTLVTSALDPLPTYVLLPPLRALKGEWSCAAPETADS